MNKENMTVLSNIIAAVESGGMIYGNKDYACYAPPYANSDIEYTITLGWAQNFGEEAQELIQMIFDKDPSGASAIDNDGLIKSALGFNWVNKRWNPTDREKAVLIKLISSDAGRDCQDELFARLMQTFVAECETKYSKDPRVVMMYCEIRHLGGKGPAERIFDRVPSYTLDNIMASLAKDQNDKSNNNQVGDVKFWVRHLKCKEFAERYAVDEGNEPTTDASRRVITAETVLNIMRGWIGMSRAQRTHVPIIDLYNSHKPLARGYAVTYDDAYCATTVSAAFIKADAVDLIGGTECGVDEFIKIFKRKGIWIEDGTVVPKVGDIICYNWDSAVQPNDGYADHIGIVESVNLTGKSMVVIEGNMQGGVVGRRTIAVGWGYIRGFARPKYGTSEKLEAATKPEPSSTKPPHQTITAEEAAKKVINGDFGNGAERKEQLEALGLSYEEVQGIVNRLLSSDSQGPKTGDRVANAESYSATCAGGYSVTASLLNCRYKPGILVESNVAFKIRYGEVVRCYGYYTDVGTDRWLLIQYGERTGYVSSKYLTRLGD